MEEKEAKLLMQIANYLDSNDQLSSLNREIQEYETSYHSNIDNMTILNPTLKADVPTLVNVADDVANLLVREPHVAFQLFHKLTKVAVKSGQELEDDSIADCVIPSLHISLPLFPYLVLADGKGLLPQSGLFVIKGVLMSQTVATKYWLQFVVFVDSKCAVYRCRLETCPGRKEQRVFSDRAVPTSCSFCGCIKEEYLRARVNGDQVIAVFVHLDSFQNNFHRHQGLTVCLKDDLARGLSLGVSYNVVVSYDSPHFQGWGIEHTISEQWWRAHHHLPVVGVPPAILDLERQLQEICPDSPWALTATLSSLLATHMYPANSFFQLRTGLLLSLASQSSERSPVPMLVVGGDCSSLLQYVSQLGFRRVTITSPALCGAVGGTVGNLWLEAGPLLLAYGGVCYIGDWAKFGSGRSSAASQIVAALEKGSVDLIANNNYMGSPPRLPLRAAVWTFWSGDKATAAAQAQLQTLIEVFGMPFIGDGSADIEAVSEHLLFKAMQLDSTTLPDLISKDDFKKFLQIVCSIEVHLTPEASKLLRNYFVASRRERPNCLPLTALKSLTSLAEAHARLCLRNEVVYEDVVLVIYLYEQAITSLYGPSLMSPPPGVFASLTVGVQAPIIAQQVTAMLKNFSLWLEQYIKSLRSENSVNLSEE